MLKTIKQETRRTSEGQEVKAFRFEVPEPRDPRGGEAGRGGGFVNRPYGRLR